MRKFSFPTVIFSGFAGGTWPLLPLQQSLLSSGIAAELWDSPFLYRESLHHYVADAAYRIRDRPVDPDGLTIIGHSMGGVKAIKTAAHPAVRGRIRRVIAFGAPLDGTWAAHAGHLLDRTGLTHVRELLPDSEVLAAARAAIEAPDRSWKFEAINGRYDFLARGPLERIDRRHCLEGPYHHLSLLYDRRLFAVIARLVRHPA